MAHHVAETHPTFSDYFVGNADAAVDSSSDSDKEAEGDIVDVLVTQLAELDAYNDNVFAHSSQPVLMSETEDSDYFDAEEDPTQL